MLMNAAYKTLTLLNNRITGFAEIKIGQCEYGFRRNRYAIDK